MNRTKIFKSIPRTFFKNYGCWVIVLISTISLISSCVPNKKIVYLQYQDELKEKYPTDSILRAYDSRKEPYKLKAEDIIAISVASITGEEYNFINKYELQLGGVRKLNQYSEGSPTVSPVRQQSNRMGGNFGNLGSEAGSSVVLERLNSGFKIDLHGNLELPQIGSVKLQGLTISQAEDTIKNLLQGYYETPMVRIQLLNFHFTILGEISNEGRYTSYDPEINIFDAIMLSGNLTELADRSNIKIVRENADKREILYLNTLDEDLLAARYFYLQPNDLIIVPPLKARSTQRYTLPRINTLLGIVGSSLSLIAIILTINNR